MSPALGPPARKVNERMTTIDQFDKVRAVYMGVYLRRPYVGMTQHGL